MSRPLLNPNRSTPDGWNHWLRGILVLALFGMLAACSSSPTTSTSSPSKSSSRYSMDQDAYPDDDVDIASIPDAVPRWEAKSRGGNKSPYTVWGKQYYVLASAKDYKERGIASWYGKKFHGYETSNGEIYSMYGMSAAHRSLPIPSYAKVTNLNNGRSVIVRVNDRGPFHGGRLIDLSYAAAKKLGYVDKGTAYVEVETIHVEPGKDYKPSVEKTVTAPIAPVQQASKVPPPVTAKPVSSVNASGWYIQVGAFSSLDSANRIKDQVSKAVSAPVFVHPDNQGGALHRVQVGPFVTEADAQQNKSLVEDAAATKVLIIQREGTEEVAG